MATWSHPKDKRKIKLKMCRTSIRRGHVKKSWRQNKKIMMYSAPFQEDQPREESITQLGFSLWAAGLEPDWTPLFYHSSVGLLFWRCSLPSSWPICFVWLWLCECWFICANNVPPECRAGEPLIVTMLTIDSQPLSPPCLYCRCSYLPPLCHVLFKQKPWLIDNQYPLLLL